MKYNSTYTSRDFYHCACILASGTTLLRLQRNTGKIVTFVFALTPIEAEEIIKKHWNRELLLPTRNIIDAIHELKTRLYSDV
jgi:hypothetical protein